MGQKIKKIYVHVSRIVKDEPKSGLKGLIYRKLDTDSDWKKFDFNKQKLNKAKKTLLLIHGTWSHTEASFEELLNKQTFINELENKNYNNNILGFDMSTLKDSVTDNVTDMKSALKKLNLKNKDLLVIAFSRGCLVAKSLFANPVDQPKIIFAGGTIKGTPLAENDNIPKVLDRITNLSFITTGGVASGIFKLVSCLSKKLLNLPGLKDQAPNSELIQSQSNFQYDNKKHIFIGANFEPDGRVKGLLDLGYDKVLFRDMPNDGVTPVSSSLNLSPGEDGTKHPNLLITSSEINHFNLFDDADAIKRVVNHI